MKGIEMIADTLCKAIGITKEDIVLQYESLKEKIPGFANRAMELLNTNDARMTRIEDQNNFIMHQNSMILDRLSQHLNQDTGPAGEGSITQAAAQLVGQSQLE